MFDARIRLTSHPTDIAVLVVLWVQLVVGLITLPYSWQHADGSVMLVLADWAQRIVTLRPVDATALASAAVAVPFPRGVRHDDLPAVPVQPAGARVERLCRGRLLFRPYQVVRSRRLNLPPGHNQPRRASPASGT